MRGGDDHRLGAAVDEQLRRARERAAGVDHVVDQHAGAALDRADDRVGDGDVVGALRPVLVDERELGVDVGLAEAVGEAPGELAAAGVGRDDGDRFARDLATHVVGEQRDRGEVVDREVEEALDLPGVQVDGDDAVGTGRGEQVGEESRGDRLARSPPSGLDARSRRTATPR